MLADFDRVANCHAGVQVAPAKELPFEVIPAKRPLASYEYPGYRSELTARCGHCASGPSTSTHRGVVRTDHIDQARRGGVRSPHSILS